MRRRGAGGGRGVLSWAGTVAGIAAAAVVLLPDLVGLDTRLPFAQLVAFRPALLAGLLVLLVPVALLARRRRGLRPVTAGLLAVALAGAGLVLPRMIPDPAPSGGRPLTVLAFNANAGTADPEQLAALIRAERPDLVALPEAGSRFSARLAPLTPGYRLRTSGGDGPDLDRTDLDGVTVLVSAGLGDVDVAVEPPRTGSRRSMSFFPTVELSGGGLGALRFVAVHTAAPIPALMERWAADLALLTTWCGAPGPMVVAGDLNATLDHSALRAGAAGCADAADQRGAGLSPTWSSGPLTRPFGPQIDHVLVGGGVVAEAFAVEDIAGSDHRAVVTRLRVP